jgi:hypothetical protein
MRQRPHGRATGILIANPGQQQRTFGWGVLAGQAGQLRLELLKTQIHLQELLVFTKQVNDDLDVCIAGGGGNPGHFFLPEKVVEVTSYTGSC